MRIRTSWSGDAFSWDKLLLTPAGPPAEPPPDEQRDSSSIFDDEDWGCEACDYGLEFFRYAAVSAKLFVVTRFQISSFFKRHCSWSFCTFYLE